MAANLLGRYIWEVNELLKSRHGLTIEELSDRYSRYCNLSDGNKLVRKTWYEHRQQIGAQFGIWIECDKRTNRYYIANPEDMNSSELQQWLLNSFAVGNVLSNSKALHGRILCEDIPSGFEFLTDIITAMKGNSIIEITYQGFWHDEPSTFKVKPYCLKIFKQRWYLVANNVAFEGIRIYGLDRIVNLAITNDKFKLPKDFDASELFDSSYGIIIGTEEKVEHIEIKVYNGQVQYFRSLPLHHSQRETKSTDDYSVFEYDLKPTFDFIQELLSHGPDIEVMEPESLRQKMIDLIKEMSCVYLISDEKKK